MRLTASQALTALVFAYPVLTRKAECTSGLQRKSLERCIAFNDEKIDPGMPADYLSVGTSYSPLKSQTKFGADLRYIILNGNSSIPNQNGGVL